MTRIMNKNYVKICMAIIMCAIMFVVSLTNSVRVNASEIPYGSVKVTHNTTGEMYSFTINTASYGSYNISHFSVVTHDFTSTAYVVVEIYKNGSGLASAYPEVVVGREKKKENLSLGGIYPPGVYTVKVRVNNMASTGSGWVGVWLYN